MEGKAMSEEQVKINEGFVAGVGLGSNTGFGVGRMTQGLVRNHALLDRFEDRRKDIIFDGQAEEQSLTIFPASESAMTIVGAHFIRAGETDRRGHSFCHGMIVDNETFSKEILPYLDTDVFNSQFLTGPQEALGDEGEEVLKFHPVAKEDTDCGEADTGDEEKMKLLYAFALKTVAAEAHYIVQIGSAGRKAFLRTLYELLPPPFRYRMESCSCGEYDQMFNVLIAADQPYTTMERYKTRTLNQILSEDISEEEKRYPNIYMIAADKMMRTGFYDFLEANVPNAECRKDISVQKLQEFLEKRGLSYGIKFTDLEDEEKDLLKDALININPDIFGDCYTVPKEVPLLRDLEEYSHILDACGKNKKQGLGLSIALGEKDQALDAALRLQRQYRDQIVKGLEWIKREGAQQLNAIQYLYSEDKVLKSVMGTIASIGLSVELLDNSKPVIGLSRLHRDIKISGRTTREMVDRGVNLGKALQDSSNNFNGTGGGHDIAAGAMIPYEAKDNFLHLVDEMVEYQLNND